jgi:hypothetical protein
MATTFLYEKQNFIGVSNSKNAHAPAPDPVRTRWIEKGLLLVCQQIKSAVEVEELASRYDTNGSTKCSLNVYEY